MKSRESGPQSPGEAAAKPETNKLYRTGCRWWKEIEVLIVAGATTGKVEANNTGIKHIKRTARGYRNPDNYNAADGPTSWCSRPYLVQGDRPTPTAACTHQPAPGRPRQRRPPKRLQLRTWITTNREEPISSGYKRWLGLLENRRAGGKLDALLSRSGLRNTLAIHD
ncbi:transposase [Pseudarthrobacter sp. CCNWLW207]|uniref:transposase n=1 Tax=Pseudarthrobacter sp. CCNWLW207 TaxID=3127468 RepID=UPI0030786B94